MGFNGLIYKSQQL